MVPRRLSERHLADVNQTSSLLNLLPLPGVPLIQHKDAGNSGQLLSFSWFLHAAIK
jgi:hypothetical protein